MKLYTTVVMLFTLGWSSGCGDDNSLGKGTQGDDAAGSDSSSTDGGESEDGDGDGNGECMGPMQGEQCSLTPTRDCCGEGMLCHLLPGLFPGEFACNPCQEKGGGCVEGTICCADLVCQPSGAVGPTCE